MAQNAIIIGGVGGLQADVQTSFLVMIPVDLIQPGVFVNVSYAGAGGIDGVFRDFDNRDLRVEEPIL